MIQDAYAKVPDMLSYFLLTSSSLVPFKVSSISDGIPKPSRRNGQSSHPTLKSVTKMIRARHKFSIKGKFHPYIGSRPQDMF